MRISRAGVWRWLKRGLLAAALVSTVTTIGVVIAVYGWSYPTDGLSPDAGGPVILTDRHGIALRKVPSQSGLPGREAWIPLAEIPPLMVSSFIVSEDARFFDHPGVDWRGVVRAAGLNIREAHLGYGGSTITMQLVRMLRSPGASRTIGRKISEAVLAMRLERALSKEQIFEQYLNRAYFGNGAYGVEAAARLYYNKPAGSLSDGEASLLAVLPRAPSAYNPIAHPGAAQRRRDHVFSLLEQAGVMSPEQVTLARKTTSTPALHRPAWKARHFTDHALGELSPTVRRRGGVVRTTLDLSLQESLEKQVADHVSEHQHNNLDQAGVVVLDSSSGEVLAMVGSAGWESAGGEVNFTTRRRHPGSALKPFVYALAIENGDSPATIAFDIADAPSEYRDKTLSQRERGPVSYREALAGSYNLAAVHTLERVGVDSAMGLLRAAGVSELEADADAYGLRLALGSAKTRLIDLVNAYRFVVRDGRVGQHHSILEISNSRASKTVVARDAEKPIVSPETAWLVMDMMSDPEARRPAFGDELPVDLPHRIAVKTGTSRGFADTVTVAVTEQFTVAAWAGNGGGQPTHGLVAMKASAPLVRAGLLAAAGGAHLTLPEEPASIAGTSVCPISGLLPGPGCHHRKHERFAPARVPTATCDWHADDGTLRYPASIASWVDRNRRRGGRHLTSR